MKMIGGARGARPCMLSFFLDYYYANCTHTHTYRIYFRYSLGWCGFVASSFTGIEGVSESNPIGYPLDPDPDPDPKLKHEKRAPPTLIRQALAPTDQTEREAEAELLGEEAEAEAEAERTRGA